VNVPFLYLLRNGNIRSHRGGLARPEGGNISMGRDRTESDTGVEKDWQQF
jgi:hypothetical protein